MQDYIANALRTKSDKSYGDNVSLVDFKLAIQDAIDASAVLDKIKKTLFYGKDAKGTYKPNAWVVAGTIAGALNDESNAKAIDIIHCILGKATEAGELLELLIGDGFDLVNYTEEIGDGRWYDAIGLAAVDFSFDGAQEMNVAKLRKRFPEKFTEQAANNRDLDAERKTLETSPGLEQ